MCDDCKSIEHCIQNLESLSRETWRDLTEHEIKADVFALDETIRLEETNTKSVLHSWSQKFAAEILADIHSYIKNGRNDFSRTNVKVETEMSACADLAKALTKTYLKGKEAIGGESVDIDMKWLNDWSRRRANIIVRKLIIDIAYKIVSLLYDEEDPE